MKAINILACFVLFSFFVFFISCKSEKHSPVVKPQKSKELRKQALGFTFQKKYDSALMYFDSSIYYNPEYAEAYAGKSLVLLGKEKKKEALTNINKAIEIAPENPDWLFNKANIYYEMEEYKEAIKYFFLAFKESDKKWIKKQSPYKIGLIYLHHRKDTSQALRSLNISRGHGYAKADSLYRKLDKEYKKGQ